MDLGQVFTSEAISDYMVSLFSKKVKRILEPCFGEGAFLKACVKAGYSEIDGCELDKELFMTTKKVFPQLSLYNTDFLGYEPEELYDGIIMNPPYIRQEKIDDLAVFGITKRELHKREVCRS